MISWTIKNLFRGILARMINFLKFVVKFNILYAKAGFV